MVGSVRISGAGARDATTSMGSRIGIATNGLTVTDGPTLTNVSNTDNR